MTRRYALCCLSIVPLFALQGCGGIFIDFETIRGSGSISEEVHTFTGLTGVQLATIGELDIRLGDKEELRISADDNLLEYFEAGKDGDTLRIGTRRGVNLRPSRPVRYTLTVRELEFIGLSSSGDANAPALSADRFEIRVSSSGDLSVDGIEANSLDVRISSSGNVKIGEGVADTQDIRIGSSGDLSMDDLRARALTVNISSSGSVRIGEGVVDSQDIRISSSGSYRGESVRSGQVTVRLSSSGSARLWAEESLDATLSSSGSVYYAGDPEVIDSHSSSGRVRHIR